MNQEQMAYRCPGATVVGNAQLNGYRLAFRGGNRGVATIIPEKDFSVEGVLWEVTEACEKSLDRYEGHPKLYEKENIQVVSDNGMYKEVMVYIMNSPYKEQPAKPSDVYLKGILAGCLQNGLSTKPIMKAVIETKREMGNREKEKNSYTR